MSARAGRGGAGRSVRCGGRFVFGAVARTVRSTAVVMARRGVVNGANEAAEDDDCKNRRRKAGMIENRVTRGVRGTRT